MKRREQPCFGTREKGVVLVMSMLMLLVLTIVGVTALSQVTLEERMARSFEQGELAFQGAETAIKQVIDVSSPELGDSGAANPDYSFATDPLILAGAICDGTSTKELDLDPDKKLKNTTLTATATVTYLGEKMDVPGYSIRENGGLVGHVFDVNAIASVGSTSIAANHSQGIYLVREGTSACGFTGVPQI